LARRAYRGFFGKIQLNPIGVPGSSPPTLGFGYTISENALERIHKFSSRLEGGFRRCGFQPRNQSGRDRMSHLRALWPHFSANRSSVVKCKWLSRWAQGPPWAVRAARRTFCPKVGAKSGPAGRCGLALAPPKPPVAPAGQPGAAKPKPCGVWERNLLYGTLERIKKKCSLVCGRARPPGGPFLTSVFRAARRSAPTENGYNILENALDGLECLEPWKSRGVSAAIGTIGVCFLSLLKCPLLPQNRPVLRPPPFPLSPFHLFPFSPALPPSISVTPPCRLIVESFDGFPRRCDIPVAPPFGNCPLELVIPTFPHFHIFTFPLPPRCPPQSPAFFQFCHGHGAV
jgi:hypothetical protein